MGLEMKKTYARTKLKYYQVPMFILGQERIIDEVNVEYEHDTNSFIMSMKEWNRIEEAEHVKIMKNLRNKSNKRK